MYFYQSVSLHLHWFYIVHLHTQCLHPPSSDKSSMLVIWPSEHTLPLYRHNELLLWTTETKNAVLSFCYTHDNLATYTLVWLSMVQCGSLQPTYLWVCCLLFLPLRYISYLPFTCPNSSNCYTNWEYKWIGQVISSSGKVVRSSCGNLWGCVRGAVPRPCF
jgi:hypothetical protein